MHLFSAPKRIWTKLSTGILAGKMFCPVHSIHQLYFILYHLVKLASAVYTICFAEVPCFKRLYIYKSYLQYLVWINRAYVKVIDVMLNNQISDEENQNLEVQGCKATLAPDACISLQYDSISEH